MKIRTMTLIASACLAASAAWASQHTEAPKPGPEVKKLEPFVGKWKGESDLKAGPWGAGGKVTSEDDCTWFEGGFQLVCRSTGSGAMGKVKGEGILGWNADEKKYKYSGFDSTGMMMSANGTNTGNTWTWTGEEMMGGKRVQSRFTIVLPTPTTQTFKWEVSEDGKTWKTMMDGKSAKQ